MVSRALAARAAASASCVAAALRRAAAAASHARALCAAPASCPAAPEGPATPLPRLHAPSLAAFNAALHDARTPFVLTGALDSAAWPAARWTPDELARRFGGAVVPVELSRCGADYRFAHHPDARARANFVAGEEMPLSVFVRTFLAPRTTGWRGYLAQHELSAVSAELAAEAPPVSYVPRGREGEVQRRLWVGPAGAATPLHRDPYDNLLCQAHGRKRVRLYAARHGDALYAFAPPAPDVLRNTSRVSLDLRLASDAEQQVLLLRQEENCASATDATAFAPPFLDAQRQAAAFPLFAAAPFWEVDLAPGEALAIPRGTWHAVLSLDAAVSVSYWW